MATPSELTAMRRAISLAAFGLGTTSPNPPVGCVILDREGVVVGEGFHVRKGEPHAEAHALAMAGERARGGTAVVTLEPCNHHGRTPPCRKALLDAGIARCVIAVIDPTSRGEGGAERLRAAGVDVEIGVLAEEAMLVLRPWWTALHNKRPYVTWASVLSADGHRSPLSETFLMKHRLSVDAVVDDNGAVTEGARDGHNSDVFSLSDVRPGEEPDVLLPSLYSVGVRSVLLSCGWESAESFVEGDLVDQVLVYLPWSTVSAGLIDGTSEALLSSRFSLREVTKVDGFVVIKALRA